ncbi:MAG: glycosyltransferase [Chloroflexi bacterium]|nr:glycosyltransferase [Chloroflexota bacterium]
MSTTVMLVLPEKGHMNPTFALVAELVQRGERVIYYAVEPFRHVIESVGAEFRSYTNPAALIPPAHEGGLFSVMAYLATAAEAVLPQLIAEVGEIAPDYLLLDSMCLWGSLVQQVLQIPAITISSVFVTHPRLPAEDFIRLSYQQLPKEILLNGIQALHSYFEITQRLDHQYGTRSPNIVGAFANAQPLNILFTSHKFHPGGEMFYDDSYKFVGPSVAKRAESVEFPFEQLSAAPLIYISLGTIFNEQPDFYNACFAAFRNMPYQVVMSIGDKLDPSLLDAPPANFIVRSYVPQLEILQRTAVFITHGGMNSTSEALLYGVPVLVVPQHGDQFMVATQVLEVGAGRMIPMAQAGPEALRGLTTQLLFTPDFKANAQAMGAEFKAGGSYVRAADEILAYIKQQQ